MHVRTQRAEQAQEHAPAQSADWRPGALMCRVPSRRATCLAALIALTVVAAPAAAADTRVYRCADTGRVVYTDTPCPDARVLDIDAGAPFPGARERLRRDQQALDARAAQRREVIAREEAIERMNAARASVRIEQESPPASAYDYAYPAYGVVAPSKRVHRVERAHARERRPHASVLPVPMPQHGVQR